MNKFHKNNFNDKSFIYNDCFSYRLFGSSFKLVNADVFDNCEYFFPYFILHDKEKCIFDFDKKFIYLLQNILFSDKFDSFEQRNLYFNALTFIMETMEFSFLNHKNKKRYNFVRNKHYLSLEFIDNIWCFINLSSFNRTKSSFLKSINPKYQKELKELKEYIRYVNNYSTPLNILLNIENDDFYLIIKSMKNLLFNSFSFILFNFSIDNYICRNDFSLSHDNLVGLILQIYTGVDGLIVNRNYNDILKQLDEIVIQLSQKTDFCNYYNVRHDFFIHETKSYPFYLQNDFVKLIAIAELDKKVNGENRKFYISFWN